MAVKIRLAKVGKPKKKKYYFRIVAMDSRKPRDGEYLEALGFYDPSKNLVSIKKERIDYWISKGAQPTETVKRLIRQQPLTSEQAEQSKGYAPTT